MDPARSRERSADFCAAGPGADVAKPVASVGVWEPGLKGLVEGVGLAVFGRSEDWTFKLFSPAAGENLEGSVPARVRVVRVDEGSATASVEDAPWLKSGKLSPVGDSGIVSRRGVELPLVGGPQTCGPRPS